MAVKVESKIVIKSYVGGHAVNVVKGATFDPAIRKYRGGEVVVSIPFSGRMLNARAVQQAAEPLSIGGVMVPTMTPQLWESVDPIPGPEEADFCIVSAMYLSACKALGLDTSRLLTMANTVVDGEGHILGVTGFNRN